jgi:D-alanyl-D-alanine carboxypeptidase
VETLDLYRATLPAIERWVRYRLWSLRVPGAQVAIGYRGEMLASWAIGYADVASGRVLREDDLFRIASHSKTFTATALLQLAARGTIRLDDTLGTYIPALVSAGSPIADATIRETMEHGAGILRDGLDGDHWNLTQPFPSAAGVIDLVLDHGSKVPAGSAFNYSNLGYSLLGMVIEAATGSSYADAVRTQIIEPLGLANTGPDWDPARASSFVRGYSGLFTARGRVPFEHVDTHGMAAATGFYGTATDLVRYFSAHMLGSPELLDDHARRTAQRRAWDAEPGGARGYGMGFIVDRIGGTDVRGHSGGFPGHITQSFFDPAGGLVVSVLTNCAGGPATPIARGIVALLDAATDPGAHGPALDGVDTSGLTGCFAGPWGLSDIAVVGDRLLELDPTQAAPLDGATRLRVDGPDRVRMVSGSGFGSLGEDITYTRDPSGAVTSIRAGGGMTMTPWSIPVEEPAVAAGLGG